MGIYDESDKNDFFENSDIPERPKPVKKPKLRPQDPRYWDEPEDEFDHLRPGRRSWRLWIRVALCAVIIGIIWGCYLRYFHPYLREATEFGYVEQIAPQGNVISTYEGVLLPFKNLMDSKRSYDGDFVFSTTNSEVAAELKRMQFANKPVRVTYEVYHTAMPWRGNSKVIVTAVDSVSPDNILPPEREPEYLKN